VRWHINRATVITRFMPEIGHQLHRLGEVLLAPLEVPG
jgi:hypothetical protein